MSRSIRFISHAFIALSLLVASYHPAVAQNLIVDGGFELGSVPHCSQGVVPADWFLASVTPDVYSFDCATLPGVAPTSFGNFTTITSAQAGLRYVGGGTNAGIEAFGQNMPAAPTPGHRYRVSAYFSGSDRMPHTGAFDVYLSMDTGIIAGVLVGSIGENAVIGSWTYDEFEFCAPEDADTRPYIIMWPRGISGSSYYSGTDEWVLEEIGECGPVGTESSTWGAVKARFER